MDTSLINPVVVGKIFEAKGYKLDSDPDRMNVFGIRTADMTPNIFNDFVCLIWNDSTKGWSLEAFVATTDPGTYWLENPMNVRGTAIVAPGQYPGSHKRGLHKGRPALVQIAPVKVYRDSNKDDMFDFDPATIEAGVFGIDIHGASPDHVSTVVDKWSAGCQVISDPKAMEDFLQLCQLSEYKYGDVFTYTLLEEKDFEIQ